MDIKFQDLFLVIFLIAFTSGLTTIQDEDYDDHTSSFRCPQIRNKLRNGRVRIRYKGRVAKFICDSGFELAGKRSATCLRNHWSNPVPACVARGCSRVPPIPNGHAREQYRGAVLVYDCNPGYSLDGPASITCDGRRWRASPPHCIAATESPEVTCDFESPELCGWSHDPNQDPNQFDWKRNQFSTPSGHAGTGPSFDHTFGEHKGGYYLYIEASSPRKINDTARLFSPVYFSDSSGGCFLFWYHMYGATTGGLRVYIKPESHVFDELRPKWELFGNQGDVWKRGNLIIPALHENFQIVIEGIRGESYVGDSAIDDVYLTTQNCDSMANETDIVEHTIADSCRGRCRETVLGSSCSCKDSCYASQNCCIDYNSFCFEATDAIAHGTDEILPEDNPISKASPITSTEYVTVSDTEKQSSSASPTAKSSTQLPDVFTPSTTLETSTIVDSSFSTNSTSSSLIPSNTTSAISTSTEMTLPRVYTVTGEYLQTAIGTTTPPTIPPTTKSSPTVESPATAKIPVTTKTLATAKTSATSKTPAIAKTSTTAKPNPTPNSYSTSTNAPKSTISSTTPVVPTAILTISAAPTAISTTSVAPTSVAPTAILTTSVAPTAISTTSVAPTTISTTEKTTITSTASTTTSARVSVAGTTAGSRASTGTTSRSTNPAKNTTILTTKITTPPTTVPITTFTSIIPTSMAANISSQIPIMNSTLLHTTNVVESTTASLIPTSASSSVTATPSTRKTYNLRPRTQRTTTTVSSTTYLYNTTVTVNQFATNITLLPNTSAVSSTTPFKYDRSTFPEVKSSTAYPTTWKKASITKTHVVSTQPTTISTTKITSTSSQHIKKATIQYTPQILRFTSTQTSPHQPATSGMGTSKEETTASNGSVPIVISLLVIIVCIAGGIAYYLRKGRNKRQSKMADDSEMRFLEENEHMEYSDASVLDRILIK